MISESERFQLFFGTSFLRNYGVQSDKPTFLVVIFYPILKMSTSEWDAIDYTMNALIKVTELIQKLMNGMSSREPEEDLRKVNIIYLDKTKWSLENENFIYEASLYSTISLAQEVRSSLGLKFQSRGNGFKITASTSINDIVSTRLRKVYIFIFYITETMENFYTHSDIVFIIPIQWEVEQMKAYDDWKPYFGVTKWWNGLRRWTPVAVDRIPRYVICSIYNGPYYYFYCPCWCFAF